MKKIKQISTIGMSMTPATEEEPSQRQRFRPTLTCREAGVGCGGRTTYIWGQLRDNPERVEICRPVTVRLVGIARNMTWYVPRQPLAWTLEGLPRSDLYQANMRLTFFVVIPRCAPGEPAKRVNAGMTVLGGMMVLSAIFVQSLMIVNFPCGSKSIRIREKVRSERCKRRAYSR